MFILSPKRKCIKKESGCAKRKATNHYSIYEKQSWFCLMTGWYKRTVSKAIITNYYKKTSGLFTKTKDAVAIKQRHLSIDIMFIVYVVAYFILLRIHLLLERLSKRLCAVRRGRGKGYLHRQMILYLYHSYRMNRSTQNQQ